MLFFSVCFCFDALAANCVITTASGACNVLYVQHYHQLGCYLYNTLHNTILNYSITYGMLQF